MNYQEFTTLLKNQTSAQPYEPQLKFAVLICKKLYFNYQKFTEVYKWGDAELLMDAITICQQTIENPVDINQIKAIIPKINLIAPDIDDFGSQIGSYALNASAAVYETLKFIINQDKIHIYNIATYYTDTVDFKIQEDKDLTQLEIEKHPLMIEAWNFIIKQTKKDA
jgi:uncharacterized protein YjaG (DUF416 family)